MDADVPLHAKKSLVAALVQDVEVRSRNEIYPTFRVPTGTADEEGKVRMPYSQDHQLSPQVSALSHPFLMARPAQASSGHIWATSRAIPSRSSIAATTLASISGVVAGIDPAHWAPLSLSAGVAHQFVDHPRRDAGLFEQGGVGVVKVVGPA
jgi:hypothetical protein